MTANERIYVDRLEGGSEPAVDDIPAKLRTKVSYDVILGCDWDVSEEGRLDVYARRGGIRTRAASYEHGRWLAVQRARNLR